MRSARAKRSHGSISKVTMAVAPAAISGNCQPPCLQGLWHELCVFRTKASAPRGQSRVLRWTGGWPCPSLVDVEHAAQRRLRDEDAPTDSDGGDLAPPDRLVGEGTADAEQGSRLLDGERQPLIQGDVDGAVADAGVLACSERQCLAQRSGVGQPAERLPDVDQDGRGRPAAGRKDRAITADAKRRREQRSSK